MISSLLSRKWSNAIIITMFAVLILFIALMAVLTYLSNAQLRSSLMEQLGHELQKRVLTVSYFYSERRNDIRDLSDSRWISAFLVNKALGMTMEYGLTSSLLEIHKTFKQLQDRKRIGSDFIYNRILFIGSNGKLIADSNSKFIQNGRERDWKAFLDPEHSGVRFRLKKNDPYLLITVPVIFKGEYAGQIAAWVSQQIVYNNLIKTAKRNSKRKIFLVCESENVYLPPALGEASILRNTLDSGKLSGGGIFRFKGAGKSGQDMLAIHTPVDNTKFSLLMTVPLSDVAGFMGPWFLPFAIGLVSVALLLAMFFVMRTNSRNQILNAHLDEAAKRRDELEKLNLKLEEAKLSLIEREERYRMLTGNLPGIVYRAYLTSSNRIAFFNNMLYPITGFKEEELEYKGICALEPMLIQEDRENVVAIVQDAVTKKRPFEIEYRVKHKDGSLRYLLERGRPVHRSNGEPKYVDGVILDVTERETTAKEKRDLESQLQRAQKMEAIGTLAGGVAHDLNNILGGLVSYPELLLMQMSQDSPLRKSILTIQKSGEKAAAVVQDLLTLARRGVVVTEVVNPNEVISEYLESPEYGRLQSYHSGVHIETHLATDTLNILGSSTHLSKTVMNLVSNAAEAMPEGGKLTISTENRYIDRPIRGYDNVKEGDYVVLTVSDTGTGISPDDMEKIFEPFYTKKKMGRSGTGLGMAVVWGTVKDHNGYIDVESTEGRGTTFTLYFPVTRKSLEERSEISVREYIGKGEAVLVVDDVEEQRRIASGMLKELGYSVVSVSSGEEAVEYLRSNKVDLLVLDMIMDPGMDGLETYRKIIEIHPGQKAIIASGFSETDRVKKVQSLGAGAYIRKPLLLEKIGVAVKEELEK